MLLLISLAAENILSPPESKMISARQTIPLILTSLFLSHGMFALNTHLAANQNAV